MLPLALAKYPAAFPFFAGVFCLVVGFSILSNPEWFVQWSKQHQADPNSVSQSTLKVWRKGAPWVGVAFVLSAVYALWRSFQ